MRRGDRVGMLRWTKGNVLSQKGAASMSDHDSSSRSAPLDSPEVPQPTPRPPTMPRRSGRTRVWVVVLLAVGGVCALAIWGLPRLWRPYTAVALLEVVPPPEDPFSLTSAPLAPEILDRYIASHIYMIGSEIVLSRAVKDPRVQHTEWYRHNKDDALDALAGAVKVEAIPGSNVILLSMSGAGKADLADIVNVIAKKAVEFAGYIRTADLQKRISRLQPERRQLQDHLDRIQRQITSIRASSDLAGMGGGRSLTEVELVNLTTVVAEARLVSEAADAARRWAREEAERMRREARKGSVPPKATQRETPGGDAGPAEAAPPASALPRLATVQSMVAREALAADPEYQALVAELVTLRVRLLKIRHGVESAFRATKLKDLYRSVLAQAADRRRTVIEQAARDLEATAEMNRVVSAQQLARLLGQLNKAKAKARDLARLRGEIEALRSGFDFVAARLEKLNETLLGLDVMIRGDGYGRSGALRLIAPATVPR